MRPTDQPEENREIVQLNVDIAERVRKLNSTDLALLLQGRASSLLQADDNQNQNQNGAATRQL